MFRFCILLRLVTVVIIANIVFTGCSPPTNRASSSEYDDLNDEVRALKREINALADDYNELVKKHEDLHVMYNGLIDRLNQSQKQDGDVLPTIEKLLLGNWEYVDERDDRYTHTFYSDGRFEAQYHGGVGGVFPGLIPGAGSFSSSITGYWDYLNMENLLMMDYSPGITHPNISSLVIYLDVEVSAYELIVHGELFWFDWKGETRTVRWTRVN